MWECQQCGCKGIAADLAACPMCEKEREMPKSTTGGASNAWEETEAVVAEATEQPAEDAPVEAAPEPQDAPVTAAAPAPKKAAPKKSAAADPGPDGGVQP